MDSPTVVDIESSLKMERGCVLITKAGNRFGCADMTTAKAMLIYHHYEKLFEKRRDIHLSFDIGFELYAAAAFGISCGENLKLEEVVRYFDSLGSKGKDPVDYEALTRKVVEVQHDMHHTVFDAPYRSKREKKSVDVTDKFDVAHRFVLKYMDWFFDLPKHGKQVPEIHRNIAGVKTSSLKFLNTFYQSKVCINYKPLPIAWAAMHLAFQMFGIQIEDNRMIRNEFSAVMEEASFKKLMDEMSLCTSVASDEV